MDAALMTLDEFIRATRLGRTTAYRLVKRGEIPSLRVGRALRIPTAALESWIGSKVAASHTATAESKEAA